MQPLGRSTRLCYSPSPNREPTRRSRAALLASLPASRVVRVGDQELRSAVSALMEHHVSLGVFDLSAKGIEIAQGDDFDLIHVPHRNEALEAQTAVRGCTCVLCAPPNPEQTALGWRDYTIWPNVFPYVPVDSAPVVITSSTHRDQELSVPILKDMLAYQRWASDPADKVRMFYHGVAGNSEAHLHWHATTHVPALERALDSGRTPTQTLFRTGSGTLDVFDSAGASGFVVEGSDSFVSSLTMELTRRIEDDEAAGAYNLMLLAPKGHLTRMVVLPRRLIEGDKEIPRAGALDLAGSFLILEDSVPSDVAEEKQRINRLHSVPLSALDWIPDLAREVGQDLVALRT